mgnify:CR=1 FL=1
MPGLIRVLWIIKKNLYKRRDYRVCHLFYAPSFLVSQAYSKDAYFFRY